MFVEHTDKLSLSSSEVSAGAFSRLLQNAEEDTAYSPFGKYFLWYLLLMIFCMIPVFCSYCGRRRRLRHAFLHRMATNGVEVLGSNVPDEEADELRRQEKLKRIDIVTQETTMVVATKDLVTKCEKSANTTMDTEEDEEAPPAAMKDDSDSEDGEQFAALRLSCQHPNGKNREVPSSCAICLCPYEVGDNVTFSPNEACQHAFHQECIRVWIGKKKDPLCPYCRQEFCSLKETDAEEDVPGVEAEAEADSTDTS